MSDDPHHSGDTAAAKVSEANLEAIVEARVVERLERKALLESIEDEAVRALFEAEHRASDAQRAELDKLTRESSTLKSQNETQRALLSQFGVGMSAMSEAMEFLEGGELTDAAKERMQTIARDALAHLAKDMRARVIKWAGGLGISVPALIEIITRLAGG